MKKGLLLTLIIGATVFLASCASLTPSSSDATTSYNTTSVTDSTTVTTSATSTPTSAISSSSQLRVFTLTELAQYNGDNGSTAYIAVNGIVYDVTHAAEWSNGWHKGMHLAGTDATAAFADSPHSASLLNTLPIVGTLAS